MGFAACAPVAESDNVAVSSAGAPVPASDVGLGNLNAVLWVSRSQALTSYDFELA